MLRKLRLKEFKCMPSGEVAWHDYKKNQSRSLGLARLFIKMDDNGSLFCATSLSRSASGDSNI